MERYHNEIQQMAEGLSTLRAMVCDLQQQVQKLKEEWEEEKHLPPYNPLSSKEEGREESVEKKARARKKPFIKPTPAEIQSYLDELGETRFTGEHLYNYYEMIGWCLSGGRMITDWKACVRTWRCNRNKSQQSLNPNPNGQRTEIPRSESAREREEREDNERRKELLAAVARKLA